VRVAGPSEIQLHHPGGMENIPVGREAANHPCKLSG